MKKILGISLMAVLAATPLMARADNAPSTYALTGITANPSTGESGITTVSNDTPVAAEGKYFKGKTVTTADAGNFATASYVKGAYNAAISAVNKVAAEAASNMSDTLQDYATKDGVISTVNKATGSVENVSFDVSFGTISTDTSDLTVDVPTTVSANIVTEWGNDTATPSTTLLTLGGGTAVSVDGTAQTTIGASTASGDITGIDVAVDGYYPTVNASGNDVYTSSASGTAQ